MGQWKWQIIIKSRVAQTQINAKKTLKELNVNCNSNKLGINGSYGPIINKIITINQGDKKILPDKILNNVGNWQVKTNKEFFIDFETFSDICQSFDKLPLQTHFNRIYLIGIGWMENSTWNYKKFISDYNNEGRWIMN